MIETTQPSANVGFAEHVGRTTPLWKTCVIFELGGGGGRPAVLDESVLTLES